MNSKIIYSTLAAVALAAGAWFTVGSGTGPQATTFDMSAQAQSAEEIDTSGIVEMTMGEEDAPVTVIEYASYTCPHCANFHANVLPKLKENYIDTGKVKLVYREIYFDRPGLWAGLVARCAGPVRYFGVTDMLYDEQKEWLGSRDLNQISADLRKLALRAGLDGEKVDACLQDADKAQAMYALFRKNAEADDIDSTPSFVIDGEKYSNMGYDEFAEILDEKLGE